jgi:hypothetical protein
MQGTAAIDAQDFLDHALIPLRSLTLPVQTWLAPA